MHTGIPFFTTLSVKFPKSVHLQCIRNVGFLKKLGASKEITPSISPPVSKPL